MNTTGMSEAERQYMRHVFDLIDRVNAHIDESEDLIVGARDEIEKMVVELRDALMFVMAGRR